jgi:hypothetical protein
MHFTRANIRTAAFSLAALVVAIVFTAPAGQFFIALADEWGWYKDPNAKVATVMWWLSLVASNPWFHWCGGAVIGFAFGVWIIRFFPERRDLQPAKPECDNQPDSISRDEQPAATHIQPELLLIGALGDNILFQLDLENIGDADCEVSDVIFATQTLRMHLPNTVVPRSLPRRARITVPVPPVNDLRKYPAIKIRLDYRAMLNGAPITYGAEYSFILPHEASNGTQLKPVSWEFKTGIAREGLLGINIDKLHDLLNGPEGSFMLAFPEKNKDGEYVFFTTENNGRYFTYNARTRVVEFGTDTKYARAQFLRSDSEFHIISGVWADKSDMIQISVDDRFYSSVPVAPSSGRLV